MRIVFFYVFLMWLNMKSYGAYAYSSPLPSLCELFSMFLGHEDRCKSLSVMAQPRHSALPNVGRGLIPTPGSSVPIYVYYGRGDILGRCVPSFICILLLLLVVVPVVMDLVVVARDIVATALMMLLTLQMSMMSPIVPLYEALQFRKWMPFVVYSTLSLILFWENLLLLLRL